MFPVASLDLETDKIKSWTRQALQQEVPLIIGLTVARGPGRVTHKAYSPREFASLGKFLESFKGLIISYNGLCFDFLVLEKRLAMKRIIPKSFDLFHWLKSEIGWVKGSRLEDLARANLGAGKLGSWTDGMVAWKAGNKKPMLRYNRADCSLTLRLFQKLVKQGHLIFQGKKIRLNSEARGQIAREAPQVGYSAWLSGSEFNRAKRIKENFEESDGNYWDVMLEAMGYDEDDIRKFGVDRLLSSHSGTDHVRCACGKYFSLTWTEWPGFRDVRPVLCTGCGRSLGNFDIDHIGEVTKDEYLLHAKRACPKDNTPLKFLEHFVYKPGSEEWDVLRCPKCRKKYQIDTV